MFAFLVINAEQFTEWYSVPRSDLSKGPKDEPLEPKGAEVGAPRTAAML